MELFIRIKDGQPFEHPILGNNFRQAFPDIDVNNLPLWVARFERVGLPTVGVYELYEGVAYERDGTIFKDVHTVRPLTAEEKAAKQNDVKAAWKRTGFTSWTFNEDTCTFDPPTPQPQDNKRYRWDETITSWIEVAV